jgi:hypothetical protein
MLAMWVNPAMPKLEFPTTAKTHGTSSISTKQGLNGWESSSFPVPGTHAAKQCSFTSSYWFNSDTGFLYMLLSDESVEGELLPDESAGRDVDRVLYELQWLHLWPIT